MDSYPQELGKKIIQVLLHVSKAKLLEQEKIEIAYKLWKFSGGEDLHISKNPDDIETTHMIEWVYVVDLNEMTFKINGGYYKPVYDIVNFKKIMEEWEHDENHDEFSNLLHEDLETYLEEFEENIVNKILKDFDTKNNQIANNIDEDVIMEEDTEPEEN